MYARGDLLFFDSMKTMNRMRTGGVTRQPMDEGNFTLMLCHVVTDLQKTADSGKTFLF